MHNEVINMSFFPYQDNLGYQNMYAAVMSHGCVNN